MGEKELNYAEFNGKRTEAYDLLEMLKVRGFSVTPPIAIENIIKFLGLALEINPDFNNIKVIGRITIKNGAPTIWVNPIKNTTEERKRFTLAHELGHFMLHIAPEGKINNFDEFSDKNISFNRDDNWSYTEMEANNFAAELLIPISLAKSKVKDILTSEPGISTEDMLVKLSKCFEVSETAMEYRLRNLGVIA